MLFSLTARQLLCFLLVNDFFLSLLFAKHFS